MQALGLVFVAVYQKALKLMYVDALLEEVKQVFRYFQKLKINYDIKLYDDYKASGLPVIYAARATGIVSAPILVTCVQAFATTQHLRCRCSL